MAAPTLFRRLVLAQVIGACALLFVFGAAFYVDRNRTVARLTAERWAPALRRAAGLADPGEPMGTAPGPTAVPQLPDRPVAAMRTNAWAPRIAMLRETLREEGVPAGEIVFTRGPQRPLTWVEVKTPDGHVRWLGIDDDVVESHVVKRLVVALLLGLLVVSTASWVVARRLAQPLEALRRRIDSHDGPTGSDGAPRTEAGPTANPSSRDGSTLEIDAIEAAWFALADRLDHQESERALLLAGVSHDLRSPLARIRMAAELLPEIEGVAQRRASIVRNVDVADRLIASFLDYVRATELPLESSVDVVAVAHRLVALRDEPVQVLALSAPARLDVPRTHELLLERLLANLVDNAMRHGRPPVLIRLRLDGSDALIEVEDHGPGIASAAQSRLTQAFARGDASRGTPGTGLGLAIVQQIVRRMGGVLSFESVDGTPCVRVRVPAH